MKILICIVFTFLVSHILQGQNYPTFGPERTVTINGLTFDAMEPFISPDGEILFFNNLNDGINTRLYYAQRVNDSTFNFTDELVGANQTVPPHLDAVADLDSINNFYWTSTRQYPIEFDNLFHGDFEGGMVKNIGRVRGDFYIYSPGWLLMDHGISYDGQELYFNNARFDSDNCMGPCETRIGIARKVNDSTFNKTSNSDDILQHINDSDYNYYAPCITRDNLELYYTRFLKGDITVNTSVEICVAVRNSPDGIFSQPKILFSDFINNIVEAPTLTFDMQLMYYHKKVDGVHKIKLRNRETITGLTKDIQYERIIKIKPNPMNEMVTVTIDKKKNMLLTLTVIDIVGNTVRQIEAIHSTSVQISRGNLKKGIYHVQLQSENKIVAIEKLIVN